MALTKVRQAIVNECAWGVKNDPSIHYGQIRPTPNARWKSHLLPITTDCSGSEEAIFYAAGAPDPSGLGYDGQGNTATLYSNAEHIAMADLTPGDFIICFKGTETDHVYIVVEKLAGGDYKMFTHGDESCPKYENWSAVKSYWASVGHAQGCRTLPTVDAPSYRWTVLNANKVLDHTRHPAVWASRHPRAFRKYNWVRFRKDVL
jgi:hypothetical protein